jgi:hypothetical protein
LNAQPPYIEGNLIHDRLGWTSPDYQRVGQKYVGKYVAERLSDIPEGALVRITIEVIDPQPH